MRSPKRSPTKELVVPAELEDEINSIEKRLSVQYTKIPSNLMPSCRSNVKNEIARVVHLMDENNKRRIEQWKVKTAKSPFNTDYYSKEVERERRSNEVRSFKEHNHSIKNVLSNMNGKPAYDVCPPEVIPKVTSNVGVQMALHYRALKTSQEEIEKEKKVLKSLIKNELKLIEETFHDKIPNL